MNTIQNLEKEIEEHAISWGDAIIIGDHRTANRNNSAINRVAKRLKKDRKLGEIVLVPLLKHTNPSVRLMASVHALDLDIHTQEAEDVLEKVAGDPNIHVVQLMAQINLQKWNKKKNMKSG
jgi:hypothetical protein